MHLFSSHYSSTITDQTKTMIPLPILMMVMPSIMMIYILHLSEDELIN
ncbi:hypothetical protein DCAR_0414828 [Daucus carota subsp. sativus]|uniref:Uncharacterized protein n=1 Tax=Daucus carota subsp. sativus TaxID=79200 RepID=A0A165A1P0_DAUCS|nr:hypothetical protein DCAR_0414828 [Daucus carota subsp. sativus]